MFISFSKWCNFPGQQGQSRALVFVISSLWSRQMIYYAPFRGCCGSAIFIITMYYSIKVIDVTIIVVIYKYSSVRCFSSKYLVVIFFYINASYGSLFCCSICNIFLLCFVFIWHISLVFRTSRIFITYSADPRLVIWAIYSLSAYKGFFHIANTAVVEISSVVRQVSVCVMMNEFLSSSFR